MTTLALQPLTQPMSSLQDSPYHAPEVNTWVAAAQGGDAVAFGRLVDLFKRDVYGKAFSILRNHSEADDVVQEVFLRVYRALPGFRFESSFRTWLITITTRQALSHLERMKAQADPLDLDESESGPPPMALRMEENQLSTLLDLEARRILREALPSLPPRQKQALTLKLERDWKYEQIASEMGTSVGSVKAHIFHAIQNLTRKIKGGKP